MHMHIPACIAVGVVFRVVVVARVVTQPAADTRSRRAYSISLHTLHMRTRPVGVKSVEVGSEIKCLRSGICDPELRHRGWV